MTGSLTSDEAARYARQLILPEVGELGQQKLLESRVLVVGAGGLGSPAALYLVAAGVGTVGIVDGDRVELSNLHRQVLHDSASVGMSKAESARRRLEALNPGVRVVAHTEMLSAQNALSLVSDYDVVVNGSDNFPTRYLVNDACVLAKRPLVDASILRFEGQAAVYLPGQGCYRCLFPEPPEPGSVPSCEEAGILGAVAGHLGTLQAIETLKLLLSVGRPLSNRLLVYDALEETWRTVAFRRDPKCPVCGDAPTIDRLVDYEAFCGQPLPGQRTPASGSSLTPEGARTLAGERRVQWVDVRPARSGEEPALAGAVRIPLEELSGRLSEVSFDEPVIFVCAIGQRSLIAAQVLSQRGHGQAYSLEGGLIAWRAAGFPSST